MAYNNTTISEVAPVVSTYYDRKLLVRARPMLVAMDFGQRRPLPANNSKVITFRRYSNLAKATTPLTEGTIPTALQLSTTEVNATIAQYGAFVSITDIVTYVVEDNVLNETVDILAEQMAETLDYLTFSALIAGTNVMYTNGSSRVGLASAIDTTTLDKVIRLMRRNNARMFTEIIKAGTGFNTYPIRPAYWVFTHPDVVHTLEGLSGFISTEKYAGQGPVHEAEIGAYKNLRFLSTTNIPIVLAGGAAYDGTYISVGTTSNDVYFLIVVAKDAYGIIEMDKGTVKSIIKVPGAQDTSNPLDQYSTAGWKAMFVAKILNDSFICRIETCAVV